MNEKPNKIFFTYVKDEEGNLKINRVVTYSENRMTQEDFKAEKHLELFGQFFKDNGIEGPDLIAEAEEKGIFARFDENELNKDALESFLGVEEAAPSKDGDEPVVVAPVPANDYALDDDEEYTNEDEQEEDLEEELEEDNKVLKRIGAGALAVAAVVGLGTAIHCAQQQIDKEKEENEDDLYKNMTEDQKAFFEPTFKAVEEFNEKTTKDGNFKLDEDKTALHITVDEAVALNIIMNDYSAEELYSIFGTLEFDTNNVMTLVRSAYSKLSTYYMNANEASGLSQLINDEAARTFFERHENAVIEFNNNPSTELSDKVIKGLYYDYVHGGSTGEYAKINNDGVAWLATSTEFGFELANRNVVEFLRVNKVSEEEIAKYEKAAIAKGMKLSKITTSELLTGINEEIDLDILDEVDNKSLCAAVTTQTRDKVEALKMKQQITTTIISANAKESLAEGLKNVGANSLANKVITSDINLNQELLDEISASNATANQLVEEYKTRMESINSTEAKIVAILEIAQEKFGLTTEIDLPELINNRFRTLEKEKDKKPGNNLQIGIDKNKIPVVDGEKFDKLTSSEKQDYIKDNGKVTSTVTTKTEVKVEKEDLTSEEKKEVVSQEKVLKEIENVTNKYIEAGVEDAISYTEKAGAYDFKNDSVTNPYNKEQKNLDDMSLFNGVAHGTAFGNEKVKSEVNSISSASEQIQNSMDKLSKDELNELKGLLSSDAEAYLQNKYGSDWLEDFMNNSYEKGFEGQIDGSLKVAKEMGAELQKSAKEAFDKAQAQINKLNQQSVSSTVSKAPTTSEITSSKEQTSSTPSSSTSSSVSENTSSEMDPNLNQDYSQEDEIPYIAQGVQSPLQYISDQEWESAYGNTVSDDAVVSRTK